MGTDIVNGEVKPTRLDKVWVDETRDFADVVVPSGGAAIVISRGARQGMLWRVHRIVMYVDSGVIGPSHVEFLISAGTGLAGINSPDRIINSQNPAATERAVIYDPNQELYLKPGEVIVGNATGLPGTANVGMTTYISLYQVDEIDWSPTVEVNFNEIVQSIAGHGGETPQSETPWPLVSQVSETAGS